MLQSKCTDLSGVEQESPWEQGPAWMLPGGWGQGPSAFLGERKRDGRCKQQLSFCKSERNEKADIENTDLSCFIYSSTKHKAIVIKMEVKVKLRILLCFPMFKAVVRSPDIKFQNKCICFQVSTSSTSITFVFVYVHLHVSIQHSEMITFSFVGQVWQSGCNNISLPPKIKPVLKVSTFTPSTHAWSFQHHCSLPTTCTSTCCNGLLEIVWVKS